MFSSPELSIQPVARADDTGPGLQPAAITALLGVERDSIYIETRPDKDSDRPPLWHHLAPPDMPLEAKRFRHVAVAIPVVRVSRSIALCPRQ